VDALLCDLGAQYGLRIDIEFMRWRVVGTLQQARSVIEAAGKENGAILVDALHLARSGGVPGDVAVLPHGTLRAMQLCDAATIAEAHQGWLPPGGGALPLIDLLQGVPTETDISVEMPYLSLSAKARLALAFRGTADVLAKVVG
jgi:sugar phosphate isomerase/epimerase